ncbi:hypothetical protein AZA_36451 [Nitrospirillum viridazoti Y2]|nr:hypothetical protein AZA_36451 [Nitrospirillum amazonense Y2]
MRVLHLSSLASTTSRRDIHLASVLVPQSTSPLAGGVFHQITDTQCGDRSLTEWVELPLPSVRKAYIHATAA